MTDADAPGDAGEFQHLDDLPDDPTDREYV